MSPRLPHNGIDMDARYFVHPGEASHGDMGMIAEDDIVLMLSNSGEMPNYPF